MRKSCGRWVVRLVGNRSVRWALMASSVMGGPVGTMFVVTGPRGCPGPGVTSCAPHQRARERRDRRHRRWDGCGC